MGGIETHLQALCGELRRRFDVQALVANNKKQTVRDVVDGVPVLRTRTLATLASTPLNPELASEIRRANADLVHIHLPNPMAVVALLLSGYKGPVIYTYHSDTVKQKVLRSMFEPLLHRALGRSAGIIVTSPNYLATSPVLARHRERCHVIPYGIDIARYQSSDAATVGKIKAQYGDRLLLSVGRLVYYKGFEYLIEAMRDVRGKLVLIGDGPLRASLEALAVRFGVTEKVVFAGEIQNGGIPPYYQAADLFVLPSVARSEAFGIVQIEALASGIPVVNTALDSGVPFVSLDRVTGLTVPPRNPRELAAAMNSLLDDSALRQSYGQAGIKRARQEFSLNQMAKRTIELYSRVLAGNSPD